MTAINRRTFLGSSLTALASLGLSACGIGAATPAPVDRGRLARSLKVLFWSEQISTTVIRKFETEYSLGLIIDITSTNEQIQTTLQDASHGYDVVIASDYMIATLIGEGRLEKLDAANIPNLRYIASRHRQLYYDPENAYSMPYFWGTTGVLYNPEQLPTPVTSWEQLLTPAPALVGRIGMLNDARETIAVALRTLKYRGNSTDSAQLAQALQLLLRQRKSVANYDTPQTNSQRVASGELIAAMTRTHNAMAAIRERPGLVYALPDPVTTVWQHNLAVPVGAANRYTAEVLINFLLRPDIAAENARDVGVATPNDGAIRSGTLGAAVLNNPVVYPNLIDGGAKFEWLININPASAGMMQTMLTELSRGE